MIADVFHASRCFLVVLPALAIAFGAVTEAVAEAVTEDLTLVYDYDTNDWLKNGNAGDVMPKFTDLELDPNVTLTFDVARSDDVSDLDLLVDYTGNITGDGTLVKQGDGGVFLLGSNSYSGGTRIEGGAAGGFLEGLSGDVAIFSGTGNTTPTMLLLTTSGAEIYEGNLDRPGWFTKAGNGTIAFDDATYTNTNGDIYITGGALSTPVSMIPADVVFDVPVSLPGRDVIPDLPALGDVYGTDPVLEITQNDHATLSGLVRGDGELVKAGAGTLILTAANSYSDGTTVRDGALQGTTQSIPGNVVLDPSTTLSYTPPGLLTGGDPVLEFDQSSSGTHSGNISGDLGSLVKAGDGTVSLRGSNTYGGGTQVLGGALNVTTSSLPGDVLLGPMGSNDRLSDEDAPRPEGYGGTPLLIFEQSSNGTYSGVISGNGNLEKRGSGTLTLATDHSFIGPTTVSGGTLDLQARLPGNLEVLSGAAAGGTGRVAGNLDMSGTLRPQNLGSSAFEVGGAANFAGSTLIDVMVAPQNTPANGATDRIAVSGQASFEAGSRMQVELGDGFYGPLVWSYDVITSSAGLVNPGELQVIDDLVAGDIWSSFDNNVYTVHVQLGDLADLPATPNQQQVLDVLIAYEASRVPYFQGCLPTQSCVLTDMDLITSDAKKYQVGSSPQYPLDALNGEGLVDLLTPRFAIAAQFSELLSQRMYWARLPDSKNGAGQGASLGSAPAPPGLATTALDRSFLGATRPYRKDLTLEGTPLGGWVDFSGVFGDLDGDGNASGVDYNLYGINLGVDYRIDEGGLVGLALGYNYTDVKVDHLLTKSSINTGQIALYGRYDVHRFQVGGALRWAYDGMKSKRELVYYDRTANGVFSGQQYSGLVEASYRVFEEGGWQIQPLGSFQYTRLTQWAFTERDAGAANLELPWSKAESMLLGLGGRFYYRDVEIGEDYRGTPELRLRWTHEFGDTDRILSPRMIGAGPLGGYTVVGAEVPRDSFVGGVGWAVHMQDALSVYANYDITVNDVQLQHVISVGARVNW